ncbi:hypothetical protein [Spirosoma jeollabukense]
MAHHDQKIATMLGDTLAVLGGGSPSTTTDEGVNLVSEWIGIVRSNANTEWVAEPLRKLRDALNANDVNEVEGIMRDLSGILTDFATDGAAGNYKEDLQNLSTTLKDFARGLAK